MAKQNRTFEVYMVYVDEERCDGCDECRRYCPCDVFDVFQKAVVARERSCLGCRTCEAVCKSKAIVVTEF